ncbi:MAG: hypothetical protein LUH10_00035 [Tannerellaceae bacterium]|nr:hypothetical protein [Tannerellaceae bacterium]
MIPDFLENGHLPEGIYEATLQEVMERLEFSNKRKRLLKGLLELIDLCRMIGVNVLYLDGSFVSTKIQPGDYDACYDIEGEAKEAILARIPETLLDANSETQKAYFHGEIHYAHMMCGFPEKMPVLEWFQQCKNSEVRKGIIKIKLDGHDQK